MERTILFSVLAEIALENGESMLPHHLVVQSSSADSSTLSMGEGGGDNEGEDEIVLDGVGEVGEVRIFNCSLLQMEDEVFFKYVY